MRYECPKCKLEPIQTIEDIKESTADWNVYSNIKCPNCGEDTCPVEEKKEKRKKKIQNNNNKELTLYDKVIRKSFIIRNLEYFKKENTITVNEFGITRKRIADIFHFDFNNNTSTIFEIKGEKDNINRLEQQLNIYNSYANIVYVITTENHLHKIEELLRKKIYGKNIGIITVDKGLNFKEIKKATFIKCFFDTFIKNLDREELLLLCKEKNLKIYGSKDNIISYLKRHVNYNELITSLKNKLNKYYTKECSNCSSRLYYNKYIKNIKTCVCFECGEYYY